MAQFEYNDLNKFYVSIGVFLIGLTFIIPWLFLRENFDLYIKASELSEYTDEAQDIIQQRQSLIKIISFIIPIVSSISLIAGFYLSFIGIKGWRNIQNLIEEREMMMNKKLSLEITGLTKEEKLEKVDKDIQIIEKENEFKKVKKDEPDDYLVSFKRNYLHYNTKFQELVTHHLSDEFKIYKDFRIENFEYDMVLKSPLLMDYDYIFEIKYYESLISQTYLKSEMHQLNESLNNYKEKVKLNAKARLIFLCTAKALSARSKNPNAIYDGIADLIGIENRNRSYADILITFFDIERLEIYSKTELIKNLKM